VIDKISHLEFPKKKGGIHSLRKQLSNEIHIKDRSPTEKEIQMIKRFTFIVLLALTILAVAIPAHAQGVGSVYVDTAWTGSEDGTQAKPYNTEAEGINAARAMAGGAYVYIKTADGWGTGRYYAPTFSGPTGTPFADALLYTLLAVLALGLILAGWYFQRRSRQLRV
jgi:hypothetical protein